MGLDGERVAARNRVSRRSAGHALAAPGPKLTGVSSQSRSSAFRSSGSSSPVWRNTSSSPASGLAAEPTTDMLLVAGTEKPYSIVAVDQLNPAGTVIFYKLQVRR